MTDIKVIKATDRVGWYSASLHCIWLVNNDGNNTFISSRHDVVGIWSGTEYATTDEIHADMDSMYDEVHAGDFICIDGVTVQVMSVLGLNAGDYWRNAPTEAEYDATAEFEDFLDAYVAPEPVGFTDGRFLWVVTNAGEQIVVDPRMNRTSVWQGDLQTCLTHPSYEPVFAYSLPSVRGDLLMVSEVLKLGPDQSWYGCVVNLDVAPDEPEYTYDKLVADVETIESQVRGIVERAKNAGISENWYDEKSCVRLLYVLDHLTGLIEDAKQDEDGADGYDF